MGRFCLTLCKWTRTVKRAEWVWTQLAHLMVCSINRAKDGLKSGKCEQTLNSRWLPKIIYLMYSMYIWKKLHQNIWSETQEIAKKRFYTVYFFLVKLWLVLYMANVFYSQLELVFAQSRFRLHQLTYSSVINQIWILMYCRNTETPEQLFSIALACRYHQNWNERIHLDVPKMHTEICVAERGLKRFDHKTRAY